MPLLLPAWQHRTGSCSRPAARPPARVESRLIRGRHGRTEQSHLTGYTHIDISHVCAWQEGWAQRL